MNDDTHADDDDEARPSTPSPAASTQLPQALTVGEVASRHQSELRALATELLAVAQAYFRRSGRGDDAAAAERLDDVDGVINGLVEYSMAIHTAVPSVKMALSEYEWRNGFFVREAPGGVPTALHAHWLRAAGVDASTGLIASREQQLL